MTTLLAGGAVLAACSGSSTEGSGTRVIAGTACAADGAQAVSTDGCNTCSCSAGQWACTELDCAEPECADGDTKSEPCSLCTCEAGSWVCTGTPCAQPICPEPAPQDPGVACPAVVVYARDPASGTCCEYGDPCHAPADWDPFYSLDECQGTTECVPGESRAAGDGCNTCSCTDQGTWLCTRMPCIADCAPGETRRDADGCNVCTCNEQGGWGCTDMPCSGEPIGCGGWLGDTCTDDEYCAYTEGLMCGATDASASCQPRPEACDGNYDPVCGCDNKTYGNACTAAAAGTGVAMSGECATF